MANVKEIKGLFPINEKYRKGIKTAGDYLFYFTLGLYFALGIGFNSMALALLTPRFFIYAMAGVLGLIMMREGINFLFVERYGWRDFLGLAICILFSYIGDKVDSAIVACTYFTVFAARNIDLRKTYKLIVMVIVLTVGAIFWAADNGYVSQYLYTEGASYRHTFGLNYPLALPAYIMNIAMLMLVFRNEKISWTEIGILFMANGLFYRWCKGDLSFGCTLLVIVLMIAVKLWPKLMTSDLILFKTIDRIAVFIHPVCVAVSLWFTMTYDESVQWMGKLNSMVGTRISLQQRAFKSFGVKLLGQNIQFVGAGLGLDGVPVDQTGGAYNYVDNLYMLTILRYGVLFSAVALILLVIMMVYCYKKKMRLWLWMLALYALHALLDDKMQLLYFNSLMLIMGQAVQNLDFKKFGKV
ncbi:hypothetical protein [Oribacterium sp. WCC10]|uniref:hypothetical protein n=1 Tax=Oribacterium sp. WCC10 TaxID=1855343 RepID=UPI0008E7E1FD|nr:hypothetical protein [Oribacterium sp. WCC10]SFG36674.1 hypothetical protein SAMN05216356_106179 [Oribacterium sp. WCC10]